MVLSGFPLMFDLVAELEEHVEEGFDWEELVDLSKQALGIPTWDDDGGARAEAEPIM